MVRISSLLCIVALLGVAPVLADTHHDGHAKLRGKGDGTHQIHNGKNGHKAHATVAGGKIKRVTASHKGRALKVTKYKTARKHHAMADSRAEHHFVMTAGEAPAGTPFVGLTGAEANASTVYVGFGFINQVTGQLMVFWFPVNMVDGGDADSEDYDGGA
jgi:hypothetical protein